MTRQLFAGVAATAAILLAAVPAQAQFGMNKTPPKNAATPELPRCASPVGTAAIQEPQRDWWTALGLSNPESLIKLMAARSNCLRIVDRNGGLAMRNTEAGLANAGDLQRGSNIGGGQVRGADYFIIPDIVNSNSNSGGANIGGVLGAFAPRGFGAVLGGLSTKSSEAQTILTLVNARTTEQEYVAEGVAKKTDISFGAGGGGLGAGGFAALAGGGYANTDIGKVITAAYFNAFIDLIGHMQQTAPGQAAAAAPIQAYQATQAVALRSSPSPTGASVRNFKIGDQVFPTGQKNGVWWEVDDENGNRGWVSSAMISPRRQ
ncbi:MAG TPA: SH3 domain-containing protein [Caulobacteraceae bacterium]|jgi:curli biogenesis system outer membrane secretion channel CsgG|nr:SH3 domain-containing protein [Caulobacteraceae bacterium]